MSVNGYGMNAIVIEETITSKAVELAQQSWAAGIVAIGAAYVDRQDYRAIAANFVDVHYNYTEGGVLFKPTKAKDKQFRTTVEEALSYFVGGAVSEDRGFALQPWSNVRFENVDIVADDNYAAAMGNYYFTDAADNEETKVEYTFVYKQDANQKLKISVHHSSLPYSG